MAPSAAAANSAAAVQAAGGVGFTRGVAAGFISAMIGFLLIQKVMNLHSHHLATHDGGFQKQQGGGDIIERTMTIADVSTSILSQVLYWPTENRASFTTSGVISPIPRNHIT